MRFDRQHLTVASLGTSQTLAWASTYYLPAMLATAMARDLGVATLTVFAAFSTALVVAAAVGPFAGRTIDRYGGRTVLVATNGVFAAGLVALAMAQGPVGLFAAWVLLGVGMGAGLYEAAFATLVRLYGSQSRGAITGITLFAGFASTVGWPLSGWLEAEVGWRTTCLVWAGLHLALGAPLNASLPKAVAVVPKAAVPNDEAAPSAVPANRTAVLLALVFAITWFVSTAMAAHLPRLLQAAGAGLAAAVFAAALVGPAQVVARMLELGLRRRFHPLRSAQLAVLAHPLGAAMLMVVGGPGVVVFTLLHGAGNGIMTIANGTLPLVLFGPNGYGLRQGMLMVPARIAQASAPFVFGVLIDRWGAGALWVSSGLGLVSFVALYWLAIRHANPTPST